MRFFVLIALLPLSACAAPGSSSEVRVADDVTGPIATATPPPVRHGGGSLFTILPGPLPGAEPSSDVVGGRTILAPTGYNAIRIGGKLAEAQQRYSLYTSMARHLDDSCRLYITPEVPGLLVYVQHGLVTRVSVSHVRLSAYIWVPPAVWTDRGIGIGSTEAEVRAAYASLKELPRPGPGADLYFGGTVSDPGLRFEFRDGKVSEMSAGIMPALSLREGCL